MVNDMYDCLNREYVCEVYACDFSERVSPNKLFGDGILRYVAQFVQERSTLEVKIQAVTKAELFLSLECIWLSTERVLYGTSTLFVACESLLAHLLSETESEEAVFCLASAIIWRR